MNKILFESTDVANKQLLGYYGLFIILLLTLTNFHGLLNLDLIIPDDEEVGFVQLIAPQDDPEQFEDIPLDDLLILDKLVDVFA